MNTTILVFAISIILAIYGTYRAAKHKPELLQADLSSLLLQAAERTNNINSDCDEVQRFLVAVNTIRNNEGSKRSGEVLAQTISQIVQEDKLPLPSRRNSQLIVSDLIANKIHIKNKSCCRTIHNRLHSNSAQ